MFRTRARSEAHGIIDARLGGRQLNITLIPGFNPGPYTGDGNNTYLIGGREPTLIDAATGLPRHLQALDEALDARTLVRVLVTHGHSDHAAGSVAISKRWPTAAFHKMPWPGRDHRYAVDWQPLSIDAPIPAGDSFLLPIHTPGHAPDHVSFLDEGSGTLFCGDLLVEGSTVVIPVSAGGSLATYLASLRRILEVEPVRALPAHGPEIADVPALIQYYLEHRQRRDEEVMAALEAGCTSREAIVARVYEGLAPALQRAAAETVWAHLIKLRDEGRVREDDGAWFAGS